MAEPGIRVFGRYALSQAIASGGMATVHLGRLLGAAGFGRTVAIKRLHPHLAKEPDFVEAFLDEARMAARIQHPNVVTTLDVIAEDDEILLVMEYVPGESLSRILGRALKSRVRVPPAIVSGIMVGALHGLHAAHEARTERGAPLELVHRDVSPQNVLVGADGVARVLDFGIAKATNRLQTTRDGSLKGKFAYMSPEQFSGKVLDRRADVFAAGVVLWEAMAAARLFKGDDQASVMFSVMHAEIPALPAGIASPALDLIVARALARSPEERFATALDFATALEREIPPATPRLIAEWLAGEAAGELEVRQRAVAELERESSSQLLSLAEASRSSRRGGKLTTPREETAPAASLAPRPRSAVASTGVAVGIGLLVLAGIGAAGFALGEKRKGGDDKRASAAAPSSLASIPPSIPPSASVPPDLAVPVELSSAKPAPAASVEPTASAASSASGASRPSSAPKGAPRATSARPPAKAACENPYIFDSNGIRHIKVECVRP